MGVVRALTFVTVRQQQDEVGVLAPLLFRRDDHLVDHGLCVVDEVAELCFP